MIGYIYIITNNINGKQYVGQTIQTIQQRFSGHKASVKNHLDNMYLHKAMNKYGIENFDVREITSVELNTLEELSEELNFLEKYYIAEYNTLAPNGYNLTKGGAESAEWIKLKVDEYDLDENFIQTHNSLIDASRSMSTTTNTAIRKCGNGVSKFAFQRIWRFHGDPLDKYELPDVTIANRGYKKAPVDKYSTKGAFICSYDSMSTAELDLGIDISICHISECCKGQLYTAYGFVWRYKGEPFDKYTQKDKRFTKCAVYDLNNVLIGIFDSILDACNYLGIDYKKANSHISQCCQGKRKTTCGYIWKYS
jgi:group I intron endonuclease